MEKIIKPLSCAKCPAVKVEKGRITCSCMKELTAKTTDPTEQELMYKKCPIGWDTEKE